MVISLHLGANDLRMV